MAQIAGKYNTSPEDKLVLDLMYIESFCIWLDIKLIFQTITVFLKASESTEAFGSQELFDFDEDRGAQAEGGPSGEGWRRCPERGETGRKEG